MSKNNIKKIISWGIGIPAAIIACSEPSNNAGAILQIVALVTFVGVLAINGVFSRMREMKYEN